MRVTDLIVHTSVLEDEKNKEAFISALREKSDWAEETRLGGHLPEVFTMEVNYLRDLEDTLKSIPWIFPRAVQVFVKGEDDDKFRVVEVELG